LAPRSGFSFQLSAFQHLASLARRDRHLLHAGNHPERTNAPEFGLCSVTAQGYCVPMTIALAKDVEDFLREQVQAGVAADPSELANDVLRCVRDQQRKPFEITPQLEAWLLEAADQPATPLTKADFDGIRQRARKRTPASGA